MMADESVDVPTVPLKVWVPVALTILYWWPTFWFVAAPAPVDPNCTMVDHDPFVVSESPVMETALVSSAPQQPTTRSPLTGVVFAAEGAPVPLVPVVEPLARSVPAPRKYSTRTA